MRRWFFAQPIHRKLMVLSMAKTTAVLFLAMVTMLVLDGWRFQRSARSSASALAAMMAENIRVALVSQDAPGVVATIDTVRFQTSVKRACVYRADGTLFSQYVGEQAPACPASAPTASRWSVLGASAFVQQAGRTVGQVYVELTWAAMRARLLIAGVTSFVLLILAAGLTFVLAHRLHRRISEPISQLAAAARQIGQTGDYQIPHIAAAQDEVAELAKAFGAMVDRVREANQSLLRINDDLRHEISERLLIEAQHEALLVREREANRVKDEFLATVSHELRTPLNAIVGWARILTIAEPDPATIAKASASLHRNALAQARVIDDLIDISRIVTGKLRVLAESVDLRNVVELGVEAIRPVAGHAGVTVTVDLPKTPCVMTGDRDRLQQVVSNLLSNAVKFAPKGTVSVVLRPEDSKLTLVVADNGVGIAPDFLAHVFDRFRQADASTTRERGGLGIGLAIAKQLVELHGGSIRAESDGPGQGATFTVVFPWIAGQQPAHRERENVPSLEGVSVLAVDDNLDALEILEAALVEAGASVRLAASGPEALALWAREPSDVLLCDLAMPRMNGFELLRRIRDVDGPAGRVTPAIAVTAHVTEEQVARSAQAGFQMHIAKPFDTDRLIQAVSRARTLV